MKIRLFSFAACGLLLLAGACSSNNKNKEEASDSTATVIKAPAVKHPTISISDGLPVVIDFSATWCPPCQQLKPLFVSLTKEYEGKVTLVTVDVDEQPEMASQFDVQSIPTLIFFNKEGEVVNRLVGLHSEAEIRAAIESL